ncbi:hypothetical protein E2C01_006652 [Portunus trituberculatus]|uniref:Uncharacterized protein n=1 Tax=Portunus trituberculatus TaxID=210409 RepID=A0A5B7CVY2_PORTR|nr:hypothetical protein [Portunus trituberculatus]
MVFNLVALCPSLSRSNGRLALARLGTAKPRCSQGFVSVMANNEPPSLEAYSKLPIDRSYKPLVFYSSPASLLPPLHYTQPMSTNQQSILLLKLAIYWTKIMSFLFPFLI